MAELLAFVGVMLAWVDVAGLFGHSAALGELNTSPGGSVILLVILLLVLWLGVWLWRRSRRKMRQPLSLNIASHLMKKHD